MLTNIDLANHAGPLRCYVAESEGYVNGTVTVFLRFGAIDDLNNACLKLRFSKDQFNVFRLAMYLPREFPGFDLGSTAYLLPDALKDTWRQ